MDEKRKSQKHGSAEEMLSRLYSSVNPDLEFAGRLERRLGEKTIHLEDKAASRRYARMSNSMRSLGSWVLGLLGLFVLAIIIVFAINLLPQAPVVGPAVEQTATPGAIAVAPAIETASLPALIAPGSSAQSGVTPTPTLEPFPTPLLYRVVFGDTCASIADHYGVSVESLVQLNNLPTDCSALSVDQELRIPAAASSKPSIMPYLISRNGEMPVNLRAGPGTLYPIVGTISGEDRLQVRSGEGLGEWVAVDYLAAPDGIAWVWAELVTIIQPGELSTPGSTLLVSAANLRRDGDKLLVDVCHELPDSEDWMVQDVVLNYSDQGELHQVSMTGTSLISLRLPVTDGEPGQRCDALEFNVEAPVVVSPTLDVLSISAYPREGQSCKVYLEKVQPLLDAQNNGIHLSCEELPGASNMTIDTMPEGMSLDAAQAIVYQIFTDAISIYGPWIFDLTQSGEAGAGIPGLESQQPLLAELRALKALRSQTYYPKPGWLHSLARENYADPGSAPDGTPLPVEYQTDEWHSFDADGKLIASVIRILDLDGKVLYMQTSGRDENPLWEDIDSFLSMDYAFTDLAESWVITGKQFSRESVTVDGSNIGERYVLEDDQSRWEAQYDPRTGRLISLMSYEITPDGLKLIHSVSVSMMEKAPEAPAEIMDLLNEFTSNP